MKKIGGFSPVSYPGEFLSNHPNLNHSLLLVIVTQLQPYGFKMLLNQLEWVSEKSVFRGYAKIGKLGNVQMVCKKDHIATIK